MMKQLFCHRGVAQSEPLEGAKALHFLFLLKA